MNNIFKLLLIVLPITVIANETEITDKLSVMQERGIENATNPEILDAYNKLKEAITLRKNLQSEYLSALSNNASAIQKNEQRIENKVLGSTGIGAIGIGAMKLASGINEQQLDNAAEAQMRAYLSTTFCSYNNNQKFSVGDTNITLPTINLNDLKSEYIKLANDLKERKTTLGLKTGIESQEILDSATAGLYDDISTGKSDGVFTSLSAALMSPSGTDATEWAAEKEASSEKIKTGAIVAGAGAVASIAGNLIINKDAPKERSSEITREYEDNIANIDQEISEQQSELDKLITENENIIDNYNQEVQQHIDFVETITESDCIEQFREYIDYINSLSLITNSYADTSSLEIPYDLENQRAAYQECVGEAQLNQQIQKCTDTLNHEWVEGECVEQTTPNDNNTETQTTTGEKTASDPQQEQIDEESQIPDCPAAGNGLSTINETSVLGEPCTSSLITDGHIAKRKNDTCTCVAKDCIDGYEVAGGACKKIDSSKFCPADNPESPYLNDKNYEGQICENTDTHILQGTIIKISGGDNNGTCKCTPEICDNDYTVSNGICTEYIIETTVAQQNSAPKKEYKYYDCCNLRAVPSNKTSICKCDDTFSKNNVTASEGIGLAYELATKKYQNEIICDQKTRILGKHTYLRCTNKNDTEQYYEFPFKSLDNGNNGFTKALCNIWELKASSTQGCKDATSEQCTEISTAINRTFYTNGAAEYDTNTNFCKIKPHQNATNNKTKWDAFVGQVITSDEINILPNIDPLYFYNISVSSNSDLYNNINNYMFNTLKLPVHEFKCGMGFIDNQQFFSGTRAEYNEIQNKIRQCISDYTAYGAQMSAGITTTCNKQHPSNTIYTDIITCEYNGQQIDFLFKKLDTKWNRKALGGMQGLLCLSKGGDFSGKDVCALPDEATCTLLDNEFKQKYPDSLGLKWEDGVCVLKDAKRAKNLEKTATVAGIVAVTLVTAGTGGPIMLTLTIVESAALVTEAVTETKISKWADSFITDAYYCSNSPKHKQSGCADTVLKKHTARITAGEKTFSQEQQSSISKNMEKLIGMLDTKTLEKIIQTAEESKIITEQLDDNDLEEILNSTSDSDNTITEGEWSKIINKYYNKGLSNDEKALIVTNKIATVATFATLFAGGIMAGMRQAVKKGWITISKDTARKWAKLRILSPKDYRAYCKKFNIVNKTDDVVKNITMTHAQAKRLDEIDKSLAKVDDALSKHPTAELKKQRTKLTQERNELLNKIGTKDDATLAVAKADAYKAHDIDLAHQEYDGLLKKRNEWDNYMKNHNGNPPQNVGKKEIESLNNQIAQAEKKLTDLGETVQPAKKLELPTVAPKAQPTAPDFDKLAKQADRNFNRRLNSFKNGKPQNLTKKNLNDDQWKQLSDHLEETEGIRIVETNKNGTTFMSFEKVDNAASITNKSDDIVSQVDNVANINRATTKVDDGIKAATTTDADNITSIKNKLDEEFDWMLTNMKERNHSRTFDKKLLTDDEWTKLNKHLEANDGFIIREHPTDKTIMIIEPKPKVTNADVANTLIHTNDDAIEAFQAESAIEGIRNRASRTFTSQMNSFKAGKSNPSIVKSKLDDNEWQQLNSYLKEYEGVQLVETTERGIKVMKFEKVGDTGTIANKVDDAADITRSATAPKSNRYKIQKTIKPFGNYTGGQKEANGVFEIIDNQSGQIMYLKRTSANEVNMTKRAANVNLGANSAVRVVQPADMTPNEINDMVKSLGITVPDYVKADTWLLTKAVPDGENLMTIVKNGGRLTDGTKITNTEIDQIISGMKKLRTAGINHTDLYTNTIVRRTTNGKLEAHIIDFESAGIHDVNFIEKELNKIKTIENLNTTNQSLTDINTDVYNRAYQKSLDAQNIKTKRNEPPVTMVELDLSLNNKASEVLNPSEYKAFQQIKQYEIEKMSLENEIDIAIENTPYHKRDAALKSYEEKLKFYNTQIEGAHKVYPKAGQFADEHIADIEKIGQANINTSAPIDDAAIEMTHIINNTIDTNQLNAAVLKNKEKIIQTFPKDLYDELKQWPTASLEKRKELALKMQKHIETSMNCDGNVCDVYFVHSSELGGSGGAATHINDTQSYIRISEESINNNNINQVFSLIAHENTHVAQNAGKSTGLSTEVIKVSSENYVPPRKNQAAYLLNAKEQEAILASKAYQNIMTDIAQYHGW